MKILSFSAVEVLPALLTKTKCQTIRPAWYKIEKLPLMNGGKIDKIIPFPIPKLPERIEKEVVKNFKKRIEKTQNKINSIIASGGLKPARFKVGEKVQLMWKSRGLPKDAVFCNVCGEEFTKAGHKHERPMIAFPKLLGTGIITEVFQIEMSRDGEFGVYFLDGIVRDAGRQKAAIKNLALKDGFEDVYAMLHYFDSHYNLNSPKGFWCYRWRWE